MINSNVFLATHTKRLNYLLRELEVYKAKGSYGGEINLNEMIVLLKGSSTEINRLQKELEKSDAIIKELNKQIANIFEQEHLQTVLFPEGKSE